MERSVRKWWEAWEISLDLDEFIAFDHHVVVVGQIHARGHGSDLTVTDGFAAVYEVRDDRIVRSEVVDSHEAALETLGLRE